MSKDELRAAILKQPSLLQYSVDLSLRPKLQFLKSELVIPDLLVGRIITTSPAIMGLSLSGNLRPTVASIMKCCDLSMEQVGEIVVTSPPILTLSIKRKIEPCLCFLADVLRLSSKQELGSLLIRAPRLLIHGIESSLKPKMKMLQKAVTEEDRLNGIAVDSVSMQKTAAIVARNPALLVTANSVLEKRLRTYMETSDTPLSVALQPKLRGRKRILDSSENDSNDIASLSIMPNKPSMKRRSKIVFELTLESDKVINVFQSVKDAAKHFGMSESRIYSACRQGKFLEGRRLLYADSYPKPEKMEEKRAKTENNGRKMLLIEPLKLFDSPSIDVPERNISIVAFTSGQIFPADNRNVVRGMYQTGGMAVYFPQATGTLAAQLGTAAKSSWGLIIPEEEGGYSYGSGCIMADFTHLNPSRNRCELCACELALKVILNLLKQAAFSTDLSKCNISIRVYTSSCYAMKLLHDNERVYGWGRFPSLDKFVYDGEGPVAQANPDLLYPLALTYSHLKDKNVTGLDETEICIGNKVDLSFHHSADAFPGKAYGGFSNRIDDYARRAAIWSYERERSAVI